MAVVAKTEALPVQRLAQRRTAAGTGAGQERQGVGVRGDASAAHLVKQAEREPRRGGADEGVEGEWRERGGREIGEEGEGEGEGEAGGCEEQAGGHEGVAREARDEAVGQNGEMVAERGGGEEEWPQAAVAAEEGVGLRPRRDGRGRPWRRHADHNGICLRRFKLRFPKICKPNVRARRFKFGFGRFKLCNQRSR